MAGSPKIGILGVLRRVPFTTVLRVASKQAWFWVSRKPGHTRMLEFVRERATAGDASSVLRAMEAFNEEVCPTMDLGSAKGAVIDGILRDAGATTAVELGGYLGYSAIRAATVMGKGARVVSIEANPQYAAVATELADMAGLADAVEFRVGLAADVLPELADEYRGRVDYMLVDHFMQAYISDVKLAGSLGLLHEGSRVVADNVVFPGAPEYHAWMMDNAEYRSELITVSMGLGSLEDGILVSERLPVQ